MLEYKKKTDAELIVDIESNIKKDAKAPDSAVKFATLQDEHRPDYEMEMVLQKSGKEAKPMVAEVTIPIASIKTAFKKWFGKKNADSK